MQDQSSYYVYIMASRTRSLFIGITSKIKQRVNEHKLHPFRGFSSRYHCGRLVFLEIHAHPGSAIAREKELKGWFRAKKVALIERGNPAWIDLSEHWPKPQA